MFVNSSALSLLQNIKVDDDNDDDDDDDDDDELFLWYG